MCQIYVTLFLTALTSFSLVFPAWAAADDYEIVDLPAPWIPVVFGVILVAGVGVLTGSLGDVSSHVYIFRENLFLLAKLIFYVFALFI